MNKRLKILLTATVLLIITGICLLLFRKKDNRILLKVPADCTSIMVIDVRVLSAKLFLDDIGREPKSSKHIADLLPDSLKNINWEANGLSLFNQIVFFTQEDTASGNISTSFIVPVSNVRKFNVFMDTLGKKFNFTHSKKNGINVAWCKSMGLLTAWDKHYVTGTRISENNDGSLKLLIKTLSTRQASSILTDSCFAKKLNSKYDIMFYTRPYQKCASKGLEIFNSNIEYMVSYISFNDGNVQVSAELKTKKGSALDKSFTPGPKDMTILVNNDSNVLNILCNVDAASARQLYRKYKPFEFKTGGMPYLEAWNGELNLSLNGSKLVENEYITYDYDDYFNKITTKKVKKDKVYDIQAVASASKQTVDSLFKLYPPVKTEKDTLLLKESNLVLTGSGTSYIVYNKHFRRPHIVQYKTLNNIEFEADPKKLILVLHELGFTSEKWQNKNTCEKISFKAGKKENINISGNLYFTDEEKNAFYSVLENYSSKGSNKL